MLESKSQIRYDNYNGDIDDDELALKLSLSISEKDINLYNLDPLEQFKHFIITNRLPEAAKLYHQSESFQPILIQFMGQLPWRISCEYHVHNGKLIWFQSWIKLGWWHHHYREIAREFEQGVWSSHPSGNPSDEYYTTVFEGSNNTLIGLQIILNSPSIFLSRITPNSGFYILQLNPSHESDILLEPQIDIGSLEPLTTLSHNLDTNRKLIFYINNPDRTRNSFYQGVTHGKYFIPNKKVEK